MSVEQTQKNTRADATGRRFNEYTDYAWTAGAVIRAFRGAVSSGYIKDSDVVEFRWVRPGPVLHCLIRHIFTDRVALYRMDGDTGRPYVVAEISGRLAALRGREVLAQVLPDVVGVLACVTHGGGVTTYSSSEFLIDR